MPTTGYPSTTSAAPGGGLYFHLSATPAGLVNCTFERVGFGPMSEVLTLTLSSAAVPANGWLGFGWPAFAFSVPSSWPSGLYRLRARGPGDAAPIDVLEFVVRAAPAGATSKILLACDFITTQAYNNEGGKNLYGEFSTRANKVSYNRPLPTLGGHPELIAWLNSNGYAVEYASLVDLHTNANLLAPYQCLVFGPHIEYWSKEMRDQVEAFVQRGGNVLSLSGNTCYRQVRFESGTRTLVCYKNARADPGTDLTRQTVAFAQPPVHRPPNSLIGGGWTHGAWGGAAQPYDVHFPTHWACAGAPLGAGNRTAAFMHYETDGTDFAMEDEGYPRVTGEEGTPLSTVVLASRDLGTWTGRPGVATATLHVRHGMVFNAATTEWIGALANPGNPAIAHITRRLLDRLRNPRPFDWEDVGHANDIVAMTGIDGKLYGATGSNRLWRRYPVLADVVWRQIGHANEIRAMAATRGLLFAVTAANSLVIRPPLDAEVSWTVVGTGPSGGLRAMCSAGSTLYAVDTSGRLLSRPANRSAATWTHVPSMPFNTRITAMTSYNGVLFAATSDNRLLRTGFDFVEESRAWVDIHHCNAARALAVVDGMLFVSTADNRLWWLDLHHGALDTLSAEV